MRLLKRFIYRLRYSIFRNNKSTKEIDDFFREQLKNPKFEFVSEYEKKDFIIHDIKPYIILLNDNLVWTTNEYYASPYLYKVSGDLPYMDTTVEFFKKYNEFLDSNKISLKEKLTRINEK